MTPPLTFSAGARVAFDALLEGNHDGRQRRRTIPPCVGTVHAVIGDALFVDWKGMRLAVPRDAAQTIDDETMTCPACHGHGTLHRPERGGDEYRRCIRCRGLGYVERRNR